MAKVKTFWINPGAGVPDRDIRDFINSCERDAFITVTTVYIPAIGKENPRITVIVTKLDDLPQNAEIDAHEEMLAGAREA